MMNLISKEKAELITSNALRLRAGYSKEFVELFVKEKIMPVIHEAANVYAGHEASVILPDTDIDTNGKYFSIKTVHPSRRIRRKLGYREDDIAPIYIEDICDILKNLGYIVTVKYNYEKLAKEINISWKNNLF